MKLRKIQAYLIVIGVLAVFLTGAYLFLLSEYSMKHLWFPLLEEKTGVQITAKQCSVSLLTNQTFSAKGVRISHPGFTVTAGNINLDSSLWNYLFHDSYRVDDLSLNGVEITVHDSQSPQTEPAFPGPAANAHTAGKKPKKKTELEEIRLPLELRKISISDLKFQWEKSNGDSVSLDTANLYFMKMDRGTENRQYEIKTSGLLSFRYGNICLDQTPIFSKTNFTMLEKIVFPKTFSFHLNTADANLTAGDFSSKGNSFALIAELAVKNSALHLKSGSISVGNEKNGDILSINLSGAAKKEFSGANLKGNIKLYPSDLADAVCSDIFKISVKGLSSECQFESLLDQGNLRSSANVTLLSNQISPYQKGYGTPILKPEIHVSAQIAGSPKELTFTLEKADLSILKQQKKIGEAKLLSAWDLMKNGSFLMIPLPHAQISIKKFPLSTLVPFGLDPKYQKETVSFAAVSKPEKGEGLTLNLNGATSFDAAGIGPVSFHAELFADQEQILLKQSRIFCGTEKHSAAAEITGQFHQKTKSLELDSAFRIHQPEKIFQCSLFRGVDTISPRLLFRGLLSDSGADLFLELSGGKYKLDLISKLEKQAGVIPTWKTQDETETALRFFDGEQMLLDLGMSFQIPEKELKEAQFSAKSKLISPLLLQQLPPGILPDTLDFSRSQPSFEISVKEEKGNFRSSADFQWKKIIVKNWENGKAVSWDNSFSLSAGISKDLIDLRKCSLKTMLNNEKTAELDLTGTLPLKNPKPVLALHSERMDLEKIIKLSKHLMPEKAAPGKAETGSAGAGKETASQEPETTKYTLYDGSSLSLRLKRLTCTKDLSVEYQGNLSVKNNTISLTSRQFLINGKPSNLSFSINPGFTDGYPYSAKLELNELPLAPLMILAGTNQGITGILRSLSLEIQGKGFSPDQLMKKSDMVFRTKLSKLSIPANQLKENRTVQVILIPLNGLRDAILANPQLMETSLGKGLYTFQRNFQAVLNGEKNLEFASGTADAELHNGTVTIKQLELLNGLVDSETITGYLILPDGNINLKSETILSGMVIPIHAGGTLRKIEFDISKSLKGFFKQNATEMLKKENLEKTIQSVDEIIKLFR